MYVTDLEIQNFRSIADASLSLQYPGRDDVPDLRHRNISLLLGNNGAGKTSILKSLALASLAPVIEKSGLVPYHFIRRGQKESHLKAKLLLHSQDVAARRSFPSTPIHSGIAIRTHGTVELLFADQNLGTDPNFFEIFDDKSPAFMVVGYGATRRVQDLTSFSPEEQMRRRLLRYQRVASLFESQVGLTPLSSWLPNFETSNPERFIQVKQLLNLLLPEETEFTAKREFDTSGDYLFRRGETEVPFGALSDGYRAFIGWVADLLYHICTGNPSGAKLVENRGLVLVDEIDLHLHPEWQRLVISKIAAALPNLQFVFTTHSPIVASSLQHENIFVLESSNDGGTVVRQYEERIFGRTAEQVLLSSYFNLDTTRAPEFVSGLQQLSTEASPEDPAAALEVLRRLAGNPQNGISEGREQRSAVKRSAQRAVRKKVSAKGKK
jgi:predicted ATPase